MNGKDEYAIIWWTDMNGKDEFPVLYIYIIYIYILWWFLLGHGSMQQSSCRGIGKYDAFHMAVSRGSVPMILLLRATGAEITSEVAQPVWFAVSEEWSLEAKATTRTKTTMATWRSLKKHMLKQPRPAFGAQKQVKSSTQAILPGSNAAVKMDALVCFSMVWYQTLPVLWVLGLILVAPKQGQWSSQKMGRSRLSRCPGKLAVSAAKGPGVMIH